MHDSLVLRVAALCVAAPAFAQKLEAPVRLLADGVPIDTGENVAHSGPLFADRDGDGKADLWVGNFRGTIQLYRNIGSAAEPAFEAQGTLQAAGEEVRIHNW